MNRRRFLRIVAAVSPSARAAARVSSWLAGAASLDITPERSLWMAGFARRTQPSQGVALPLRAKALALQHRDGRPVVLVTVDLLGVTARLTDRVAAELQRLHGVRRAEILFNASHTHCGPVVDEQLSVAYDLAPAQWDDVRAYTAQLESKLVAVAGEALTRLRPARIGYARGEASFAANRRVTFTPAGPVDHGVPVLRVDGAGREPLAIVFGYACHNTTLQDGFVQYHGDYAGVAQAALELRHPGTTALFVAGCGADANPKPRGTVELVQAHGTELADAVDHVLPATVPVTHQLATAYGTVALPFVDGAARERWHAQLDIEPVYLRRHAALMQAAIARDGRLPASQHDPCRCGPSART
jgi:neutral ceramidase